MKVNELITRADTIDHLLSRAEAAAGMCDTIGDHPLVYRHFKTGLAYETLLAKVVNRDESGKPLGRTTVRSGGANESQPAILEALGIEFPVFCIMTPPTSIGGYHGDPHIFIPPAGSKVVWSSKIVDLGGQEIVGDNGEKVHLGKTQLSPTSASYTHNEMLKDLKHWVSTYKQGWPSQPTNHELIFDCETYYLLNLEVFLKKFAGKKNKEMISNDRLWAKINQELFQVKFKNYASVAWYLRNTVPSFLEWFKKTFPNAEAVVGKPPTTAK
jgi:hypothetical protein